MTLKGQRNSCGVYVGKTLCAEQEAILQMNLLDHSFFVFRSSEDDSLSIVYKRKSVSA